MAVHMMSQFVGQHRFNLFRRIVSSSVSARMMRRVLPKPVNAAFAFLLFSESFHL